MTLSSHTNQHRVLELRQRVDGIKNGAKITFEPALNAKDQSYEPIFSFVIKENTTGKGDSKNLNRYVKMPGVK